jgi:RNA polymerase sigma factor (sigma-70 family)
MTRSVTVHIGRVKVFQDDTHLTLAPQRSPSPRARAVRRGRYPTVAVELRSAPSRSSAILCRGSLARFPIGHARTGAKIVDQGGPPRDGTRSYVQPRENLPMSDSNANRRLTDWFRQWRSPLRKFLIRRDAVPSADVDDISQEVFLRLLRYNQGELVEHPQAYLFKMACNVAAEWSLRARVRRPHDSKWLDDLLSEDLPEDAAARAKVQEDVERAINTLSPRHREILKLQYYEGLGYAEIAERLGSTTRSVKRSIIKSYQKLRMELDPESLRASSYGRE